MTTIAPLTSDAAWASKNCPDGSHAGKGPDPKTVYCYDNARPLPDREDHLLVNDTKTLIRPASEAAREAVTRTFDTANPAWATSAAQYRLGPRPTPANGMEIVAEYDGHIVGVARVNEALEGLLPRPGDLQRPRRHRPGRPESGNRRSPVERHPGVARTTSPAGGPVLGRP